MCACFFLPFLYLFNVFYMIVQVLRLDPRDPDSNVVIARLHQRQGRGAEAIDAAATAADADPARHLELGQVQFVSFVERGINNELLN